MEVVNQPIPKTKKECFALLDEMLSKEDKEAIAQMEDTIELHFTLGLWIRNNWIYNQTEEEIKALLNDIGGESEDDFFFIHPDDYSSTILDAYQDYLKSKR